MKSAVMTLVCLVSGCGLTFGVEAVDRIHSVDADATGVTSLVVSDLGVEGAVSVCGAGDRLVASVHTTEWTGDGASSTGQSVDAGFDIVGDSAVFVVGGGDETIVLTDVSISAPPTMSANLSVAQGSLTVCDFSGPVTASVPEGQLTLRDISAPIDAVARSVTVDFSEPIELTSSGAISGTLAAGGYILASGSASVTVVGDQPGGLELEGAGAAHLAVWLPAQGGWTIRIRSEFGTGRVLVGGVDYSSTLEDAEPVAAGLEFDVRGGGPVISISATNASVAVWESAP